MIRERKGQNLSGLYDNYTVVDLETTGLDPSRNEIIEIGAVRIENGNIAGVFNTLIKPENRISGFITQLTGITNEMVKDAPAIECVLSGFYEFTGNSVIVGHNVNFDINFLYDNLVRHCNTFFNNDYVDTMYLSRRLFKDFENHKLSTLASNFCINYDSAHRAYADCMITQMCYEYIKNHIVSNKIDIGLLLPSRRKPYPRACIPAKNVFASAAE